MPESQISQKWQERGKCQRSQKRQECKNTQKNQNKPTLPKNYIVKNASDAKKPKKNTKNT